MAQVINTGGSDSGAAGIVVGVLITVLFAAILYYFVIQNDNAGSVETPNITINTPAAPEAPDINPAQ